MECKETTLFIDKKKERQNLKMEATGQTKNILISIKN